METKLREHPVATLATAAIFTIFFFALTVVAGIVFYLVGWTDSIFELSKWARAAIVIATVFGLIAAAFEWVLGVNDE